MTRLCFAFALALNLLAVTGGELHFALRADPKTFDPLLAADEASEVVRYLTGGVLIRRNRLTQELEPDLATSWKISEANRRIDFQLRSNVQFSDGTPFSCADVAFTLRRLMDPSVHAPVGDTFRTGPGNVEVNCSNPNAGMARFPAPVAALASQFDEVNILSARSPKKEAAVLGPFEVGEYRAGTYLLMRRNPHYWKRDSNGKQLPYLESIRLEIQQNRETEVLRFRRGETDFVNKLDPVLFDQLAAEMPKSVVDIGPALDWEVVFFNQVANSPLPEYKKEWFRSADFRRGISEAINREDLCRIVYHGHARPAAGPISPSNRFWLNTSLKPPAWSVKGALERMAKDGFHTVGSALVDRQGHPVEFSLITNAGSKIHERMMTLIQQDLSKIGVHLNVVILDFPSLIERISSTFQYEACLMALNVLQLDPNDQMNVWISSGANHQWNPNQKTPATSWEGEIDRLMATQNSAQDDKKRKASFDRVQEILSEQAPMLFLVHPDALVAISQRVKNVSPALLRPQLYWNVERLSIAQK